ncbi:hypothetical protein PR048_015571 [Dryococelus australis]|uniref:Uncharacterized protein n=1 Tax=Dryococelus australis TaxID=614101 RepID=A0ABQ9HHJ0_9NEOP|nr:hypothetical protein PR048_015571 [Dryococelus australis]
MDAITRNLKQMLELFHHISQAGTNFFQADIKVITSEPFHSKTYQIRAKYLPEAMEYLQLMLSWNNIQHGCSPF